MKKHNFSAGPSILPREVIEETAKGVLDFNGSGLSVMEISHRSKDFQAVMDEWEKEGILEYMDLVLTQNDGSKAFCIQELLKKGYALDQTMMVGDAPGDYDAAKKNGVCFFPILVKKEAQSWSQLRQEAADRFLSGSYRGEYEEAQIKSFQDNLR